MHSCAFGMADLFVNGWIALFQDLHEGFNSMEISIRPHRIKPYVFYRSAVCAKRWEVKPDETNRNPKELCRYYGHYLYFLFGAITVSIVFWGCLPTSSGCKVTVRQSMSGDVSAHTGWSSCCSCLQVEDRWKWWSSALDFRHFETHRPWKIMEHEPRQWAKWCLVWALWWITVHPISRSRSRVRLPRFLRCSGSKNSLLPQVVNDGQWWSCHCRIFQWIWLGLGFSKMCQNTRGVHLLGSLESVSLSCSGWLWPGRSTAICSRTTRVSESWGREGRSHQAGIRSWNYLQR